MCHVQTAENNCECDVNHSDKHTLVATVSRPSNQTQPRPPTSKQVKAGAAEPDSSNLCLCVIHASHHSLQVPCVLGVSANDLYGSLLQGDVGARHDVLYMYISVFLEYARVIFMFFLSRSVSSTTQPRLSFLWPSWLLQTKTYREHCTESNSAQVSSM